MSESGGFSFEDFRYYPSLRTRGAEMKGYKELEGEDKDSITPICVLGKWRSTSDVKEVARKVDEWMEGRPYFLDHTFDIAHFCNDSPSVFSPEAAFVQWRNVFNGLSSAIPTALITPAARPRDVARQCILLEGAFEKLAIRIRDFPVDLPKALAAYNAIDNVNNMLAILDLEYVRNAESAKIREAIHGINSIRDIDGAISIVCMGTSYPRSVAGFGDARGGIEIIERDIFEGIGGDNVAIYGDHASIHVRPYEGQTRGFVPRVDYPLDHVWLYERRRREQGGYVEAAQAIRNSVSWDPNIQHLWGARCIDEAAQGNIQRLGAPVAWISVRVNLHINRQISRSKASIAAEGAEAYNDEAVEDLDDLGF